MIVFVPQGDVNRRYSSFERVASGVDLGAGVMGGSPIRERCRVGLQDDDG